MPRLALAVVVAAVVSVAAASGGPPPLPQPVPHPGAKASLPAGKWAVEYANQITEVCEVQKDGTATIVQPVRIAGGKAVVSGGSVVMIFDNGRVQRWTPAGKRFVVEHWLPGSSFSAKPDVLGIAEHAR